MGVIECRTWKQLVLQGKQAEKIIARVKAEEKDSKPIRQVNMTYTSHLLN